MNGCITHQFICRYFDTKDICDLNVLRRAKLNPMLKKELLTLLRNYFKDSKKEFVTKMSPREKVT